MLKAADAEKLTVPLGIYISKDEPVNEVRVMKFLTVAASLDRFSFQYQKVVDTIGKKTFAEKNDKKIYSNMFHGWAAARADLKDAENKKEFEDVYGKLVNFFCGAFGKS
ncbi:hypothetical protein H0H87_010170 [Tephrocybe sp. NHM501043]|nr:hypothetical protein H0H87_010170 [Tephrocybe sp. NHM501043]